MNLQTTDQKTVEQIIEAVFALDLDPIKFKLMDAKEGHGWTREEADRHELEYRRFLALVAKYPGEAITPDTNVDKFWHGHILDTMKYAEDCEQVFGYFLHHFPYFGMRDDEDAANLAEAAAKTRSLYQQEFGHLDAVDASYCARVAQPASAYCARAAHGLPEAHQAAAANAASASNAYCARVAVPEVHRASYCARVAAPQQSYCARVAKPDSAYCARVAAPAAADASYCARTAAPTAAPAYLAKVIGKGRPTLASGDTL
ncbi:glycine-rich domain-containing protein [Noviherbaspirillum aerium]|uniref:glycine-rich domain-containing protein n=1 Tax=Noviherbaspirillum aerium TaxID=2588497 RepID=UPI00124ED573|nr:hypothetical protein [Noviherbaspirillum aerium]